MRQRKARWEAKAARVKGHAGPRATVAKGRRPVNYSCRWTGAYRLRVGDGSEGHDTWSMFLRRMTKQPGWSVARLARESGIARQTIFAWMKEGSESLTVASVRAVAKALNADMATAMLAAGGVLGPPVVTDDEEMRRIVEHPRLSPDQKDRIIAVVRARRARSMEETQEMIDLAAGEP